jgi:3'-5' exoribonuclease
MVRKIYVRDLTERSRVHTVFKVSTKQRQMARSGKAFLIVGLVDKTGEVDARVFDRVDELEAKFGSGDYVLVNGEVIQFHGRLQIKLDAVERLDPEPIDASEFDAPAPPPKPAPSHSAAAPSSSAPSSSGAVAKIRELVEAVNDHHVRALLLAFLDDPRIAEGLPVAPAAKTIHHAYPGGLADHILSVIQLAHRMADHYPMADRDLLVAGALLHDIGKVFELSYSGDYDYTDEGRLVGHLVITAQKIREKAQQIPGFSPLLEQHITHLVLAHHGQLEYGSPKLPMTLEALIVHTIDMLDSKIASWLDAMSKDGNEKWTDVVRLYERHLWKGKTPTVNRKSPTEGFRRSHSEKRRNPGGKKDRHARREKEREAQASAGPKLSFKPLSDLTTASAPHAAEETPPPSQAASDAAPATSTEPS